MSDKMYKIRRKTDGMYSLGGTFCKPAFTKNGKMWKSIGALRTHLGTSYEISKTVIVHPINKKVIGYDLSKLPANHAYKDCEIVEVVLLEQPVSSVTDFIEEWNRTRRY